MTKDTGNEQENTILIRSAEERDFDALMEIEKFSFSDGGWSERVMRDALSESHARVLVAEKNGEVVGFTVTSLVIDESELLDIAVRESRRGEGIGRVLLTEALEDLRSRGAIVTFLEVREHNTPAVGLYESAGFTDRKSVV